MEQNSTQQDPISFGEEVRAADFGNLHLTKRFSKLLESIKENPDKSFPEIFGSQAELEGAYRFFRNPNVTLKKVLFPHLEATCRRVAEAKDVLILHDTTDFQFSGEPREGLGYINNTESQGFFGHFALAVSHEPTPTPLGVIGLEAYSRIGKPKRTPNHLLYRDKKRESLRWGRLVSAVEKRLTDVNAIHVMDREADIYELLDELCYQSQRFVIRLSHDRALKDMLGCCVSDALEGLDSICEREVVLSRRVSLDRIDQKQPRRRKNRRYLSIPLDY
jgi:hypothetical protein